MILSELHERLGQLLRDHGDCLVIDNDGNDVTDIYPPLKDADPELPACDDARAVMLTTHIDYELRAVITARREATQ